MCCAKEVEQLAFLNCPKLIVDATAAPRYIRRSYLLQGRSGQLSIRNQKGCEPGDRSFAWELNRIFNEIGDFSRNRTTFADADVSSLQLIRVDLPFSCPGDYVLALLEWAVRRNVKDCLTASGQYLAKR